MAISALLGCCALAAANGTAILAQEVRSGDPAETVEDRLSRIEAQLRALSGQLQELEASGGGADEARVAELEAQVEVLLAELERLKLGEAAPAQADRNDRGLGPAASKVYRTPRGVSVGGYGELVYERPDDTADDGTPSGETANLDLLRTVLYFGYKWNDRILFNSEIEYEHATTGAGDEDKGEVSVEFAYLDFMFTDAVNARAGLLLIPMGFVNEVHEPTTFYGVQRPLVERVIIPATWRENGAGIFGDFGPFTYRAYVTAGLDALGFSAGSGIRGGRQKGSESLAEDLALTGRIDLVGIPGLTVGLSGYSGGSSQGRLDGEARVTLWDAHAQFEWRGLQLRGLFADGSIDDAAEINQALEIAPGDAGSIGEGFGGWYVSAGWDLLSLRREPGKAALAPFVRYEQVDTQDGVPQGWASDPESARSILTVGLDYRPIPQVAIKLDFQDHDNDAGNAVDAVNAGVAWIF